MVRNKVDWKILILKPFRYYRTVSIRSKVEVKESFFCLFSKHRLNSLLSSIWTYSVDQEIVSFLFMKPLIPMWNIHIHFTLVDIWNCFWNAHLTTIEQESERKWQLQVCSQNSICTYMIELCFVVRLLQYLERLGFWQNSNYVQLFFNNRNDCKKP